MTVIDRAIEIERQAIAEAGGLVHPTDIDAGPKLSAADRVLDHFNQTDPEAVSEVRRRAYARLLWARTLDDLTAGKMAEGWSTYHLRKHLTVAGGRPWRIIPAWAKYEIPPARLWRGHRVRKLVVHAEGGLGDQIQFARYLPLAAERCDELTFVCASSVACLLAGKLSVVPEPPEPTAGQAECFLMDLPAPAWPLYGYHVDGMAKLFGAHRCRHNDHHTLRVGLCWRGDPQNPNDRRRSVDWPVFEPLLRVAGCQFVSLQQQAADHPELEQPSLTDWNATAAVIAGLDLVITVDTSIGHLAGSMGVPTWILVEPNGDWRWRSDMPGTTPWYPSARLFRHAPGDTWPKVLQRVRAALEVRVRQTGQS